MSTPVRVAAFVTALVAVFVAALGAGRLVGPVGVAATAGEHGVEHTGEHASEQAGDDDPHGSAGHDAAAPATDVPGGLAVSADGYTLTLDDAVLPAGDQELRFRVLASDGKPLTAYDEEHEKELHLIVVRRDVAGYQHLHPTRDADGTWATDVALTPGSWRVLADLTPAAGRGITLGADLAVPGRFRPDAGAPQRLTDTVDGYEVTVTGGLAAGGSSHLTVSVRRDGEDVLDLEPYLGAYGHLVALREGDLAYLHVHPEAGRPGPDVPFVAEVPSEGRYRLFFDFQHGGVVRTASFVLGTEGHDAAAGHDDGTEDESHDH
ncbi:MAG: FIG00995371: possibly secreted protein [uncultured Nocardioides sp.]|uniref:FIG00995371: possibly secreted protein n=1 Tax=uncultured Nocardioides sp. TaxID=198441 RepID=A0A6J4N0Z5_9ACTN|nr:MAG: FIG00995371: possibly secreted protein [uncultured Nocardioides sp.]